MMEEQENIVYYITVMNEAYAQPAMPEGLEERIIRGMYLLEEATEKGKHHVQLTGNGTILREVREAATILQNNYGISPDSWSVTSFNELRLDRNSTRLNS